MRMNYLFLIITLLSVSVLSGVSNAQNTDSSRSGARTSADERMSLQKEFFPKIPDGTATMALPIIASYAKKLNLKPLEKNHLRFFVQPMGYVQGAIDVNLVSGNFISYPGTRDTSKPLTNTINYRGLTELRAIFTSKDFLDIPSQNKKVGADGSSLVIEVDINDSYKWICHWSADDKNLLDSIRKLNDIVAASWIYAYVQQTGEGTLKANHVRLFEPEGRDVAYSITDIDLVTGKLVSRRQGTRANKTLNKEQINQLKQELLSENFHNSTADRLRISRGGSRPGGSANMIEYDIDGIYFRKTGPPAVPSNTDDSFTKVKQLIIDFLYNQ
jgi:hypothetical protein